MPEKETSLFEKFKLTGKHGIIYGVGSVLQQAISFLLLPLYTTRFEAADYGILGLITVTGSVLTIFFTLGINYGLLRSYYDYKDEKDRRMVISTALFIVIISSLVLLVLGISLAERFSLMLFETDAYKIHFIIMFITAALNILNIIPIVVFRMKLKSSLYITLNVSFFAVGIGVIIYMVNFREAGILGPLVGHLIMAALTFASFYFVIRKEFVSSISRIEIKKMLYMGLPLIPANLSAFIFNSIDRYFLNYYSTTTELGLYNLAYNFGKIMTVIFATPIALIWPIMYLSVKDDKNAKDFYIRALTYGLAISMLLFLFISLLSKDAIVIFSNPEYRDAYIVIPIIVFTYALWALRKIINVAVTLKRKTTATAVINIIGAAMNVGLNFLLIPRYGMLGAAFATLVSFIVVLAMMYYYNQRLIKLDHEWLRILKILLATGIIFSAGYFVAFENVAISIIYKILIILCFLPLLLLLRFFTPAEIQRAKTSFGSLKNRLRKKSRNR